MNRARTLWRRFVDRFRPVPAGSRLHIGCGDKRLAGWINMDMAALPGVDIVADVTRGLPYSRVDAIYAEHFLEHLAIDDAVKFLGAAHGALAPGAWLRLSTPNLDWVWATHYRLDGDAPEKCLLALRTNRAFRAWGHQFLWNRELLGEALEACGFADLRWCAYGESELPVFANVERHETYEDSASLPHVLIVEAQKADAQPERLARLNATIAEQLLAHLAG